MVIDSKAPGCPWCYPEAIGDPILALFAAAPNWNKLHLDGVAVARAGDASSNPGGLWITDGEWGGTYYGSIRPDGTLRAARAWYGTWEVREQLAIVAAFGTEGLARLGRASGRCVYCGKRLTDPVSIAVGYGPICAKYHNLPHNAAAAAGVAA